MARITHAERVELADNVYLKGRTEIEAPPGWVIAEKHENPDSGLEIYALRKENTNEVVFAVRGSDTDGKDWVPGGPNFSHIAGKLHEQDKEALSFVDAFKIKNKLPNGSDKYHYSVTGDSKGGATSQIIAHTFGMRGTTTDSAAGGGAVKDPAYLDFVRNELKTVSEPLGVPKGQFLNIREEGSPVPFGSAILPGVGHLGETVSFNFVVTSAFDALLNPFATLVGQHTNRTERITALNNAHPPGEVDPIFILFNDKISKLTSEITRLEGKLDVLNKFLHHEREHIKEIEDIERELHSLQKIKNEDQATRESVITGEYGGASGFVDQWAKSYLENVTSTNNPWVTDKIVLPAGKVVAGEDRDPLADNFIPPELKSSQLFFLPNDANIYILTSDGKIIKCLALASTEGGGVSVVINDDNLPTTREELLAQLKDLGVPEDEAKAIADRGGPFSPGNNLLEDNSAAASTIPDLFSKFPDLLKSFSELAKAVQEIEGVGAQMEALVAALKSGNDLKIYQTTVGLLQALDTSVHSNSSAYKTFSKDYRNEIGGTIELAGAIGDLIGLQKALEKGDGWAIADSATAMVNSSVRAYNHFTNPTDKSDYVNQANGAPYASAASSLVGLGMSIKSFTEAMESGSDIAKIQATLSVVQSGLSTYVAVAQASAALTGTAVSAATTALGNALPAVGCAIGVAQGILAMADGDIQGGAEQIALATATYVLYCIPVYGWIIALALQVASATRNCDGQIIDTDNIREFSGKLGPGGELYADSTIASIEKPAQWATDVYQGQLFLSGFNVEMYEEIGVDIPEDMHAEFAFAQANAEFFNPLRYAGYFQDLDEMSLADIWDSLYISQGIAATIDQIKNSPDFLKSSILDAPELAKDLIGSLKEPGKILGLGKFMFGKTDPPQATTSFTLGEDGEIQSQVRGDKAMHEAAKAYAPIFVQIMDAYRESGGRLEIDGALPSLTLAKGGGSAIGYRNEAGGRVNVLLGDMSRVLEELQTVLIARDRGERLESAVRVARDVHGDIDLATVDAIMAGHGFSKNGITYTYGETGDVRGVTFGSGVFRGGGNMGPEGQHFTATHMHSLPLREEQLPSQRMGEILKIIGLNNTFSGAGSELLAMALALSGGVLGLAAPAMAAAQSAAPAYNGRPLAGKELDAANRDAFSDDSADTRRQTPEATTTTRASGELLQGTASKAALEATPWLAPLPPIAIIGTPPTSDPHGWLELRSDGSRSGRRGDDQDATVLRRAKHSSTSTADDVSAASGKSPGSRPGESFSGYRLTTEEAASLPGGPAQGDGPVFRMSGDGILRFLLPELTENHHSGTYGDSTLSPRFLSFGEAVGGRVYQEASGDVRFAPTPGFSGTASFTYLVADPSGAMIEKRATVIVEKVNGSPVLVDDHFLLAEGEPFVLSRLLANDRDPDNDTLILDHLRGLSSGEVALINGQLTYLPEPGYHGEVTFTYWVKDRPEAYPLMARATLTYSDAPTPPAPGDDRFLILEDSSLTVSAARLLENDRAYDGEPLTIVGLGSASHGTVDLLADGSIRFIPEAEYSGSGAGFTYTVEDGSGLRGSAWVEVEIQNVRKPPVITATTRPAILEDTPLTFTPEEIAAFVHDPDGDRLYFDLVDNVQGGRFVTSGGYYTFIPVENYFGPASFDYVVTDNQRGTASGSLTFDILPVNDAIIIGADSLSTSEDQAVSVAIADLIGNDTDPDGTTITFAGLGPVKHGIALRDGDQVRFTPDADYNGNEAGFTYMVSDDQGLTSSGWVSVAVSAVNDEPTFTSLQLGLDEDQPLVFDRATLARIVNDVDGDELRVTAIDNVLGGTVSQHSGLFTFTPDPNYYGPGELRLTVSDGHSPDITATLQLAIAAVDDPATLPAVTLHTEEEQAVTLSAASLLAGAVDVDGPLHFAGVVAARHGKVVDDGHGNLTFTPDIDYFGDAAGFTYQVEDALGGRTVGRVDVRVAGVNDAPQLIADTLTLNEDQPLVFDQATLARFLHDRDGDPLNLESLTTLDGGTISRDGDLYTYTPAANFHGSARLALTATDNNGGTVSGIINLDILSVDDPTRFGDDTLITDEEQAVTVAIAELLANDYDDDGPLSFVDIPEVRHGTVTRQGDELCFLPDQNYFGDQAGFSYRVEDGEGHQATAWVTVRVNNIPDAPRIVADRLHWREDTPLPFTPEEIAKFLVDDDGEPMRLEMVSEVEGGTIEQRGDLFTFLPHANFYGEASFAYRAGNASGETLDGRLALFLAPVNDLPTVVPLALAGIEDEVVSMTVEELLARGSDIEDGSGLRFGGIESSLGGDVHVDDQGRVHFLPEEDFFGDASFNYRLIDSEGGVGKGTVNIAIAGVNDAPVARDDHRILAWSNNSYENIYLSSVFTANDYDVDGDPLRLVAVGAAEYGSISLDGAGQLRYVAPTDRWVGIDRFTYQISDDHGLTATATAWLDVRINTSPDVYSELLFTSEDVVSVLSQSDLLANDNDIDGDTMTIIAVDQAEHCQVTLQADGSILFVPEQNYNNLYPGQASFRYTVSDGISDPVWSYAFFDIEPVNDAPILRGERIFGAVEDNSFSFSVADLISNDTDVEMASPYESDSIHFAGVWGAGHGSISWDQGSDTIYYVPDLNFCGVETFSYTVVDSYGASSSVTSEIYVEPVNDLPVVQEDVASTAEDSVWNSYSIAALLANDYDVDGDILSIKNPRVIEGNAEVTISGGNLKVKPAFREDRVVVTYTVSDGNGGEVESRLTMPDIREHNFAPLFSGLYAVAWKNSYTVWFNFHAYDPNGGNTWGDSGEIVGISCSAPSTGSLTDEGYTFKFKGDTENASLTLTVADQAGASGSIFIEVGRLVRGDGNYHYTPVVLDLDGDGIELLDISAGVSFDWNGDGRSVASGWIGGDDGFLAYDFDGDGVIRYGRELAFKDYDPQATTDLEGLRSFDSNNNDRLDQEDEAWKDFGVWQDSNSDGIGDPGEFTSLDNLGIASISLTSDEQMRMEEGNIVFGNGTYQKTDGSVAILGDVGLQKESPQPQVFVYPLDQSTTVAASESSVAEEIRGELLPAPAEKAEDASTSIDHLVQQLLSDIAAGPPATAEAASATPTEFAPLALDHPAPVLAPVEEADFLV